MPVMPLRRAQGGNVAHALQRISVLVAIAPGDVGRRHREMKKCTRQRMEVKSHTTRLAELDAAAPAVRSTPFTITDPVSAHLRKIIRDIGSRSDSTGKSTTSRIAEELGTDAVPGDSPAVRSMACSAA
jgi:hypothetical protein